MKTVKRGRIQQQDVSTLNLNARARNPLIQVPSTDVGLRLLVRDIDAARRPIEEVERHLLYPRRLRIGKMPLDLFYWPASCIDVSQQQPQTYISAGDLRS